MLRYTGRIALLSAALALSGCNALFKKEEPMQGTQIVQLDQDKKAEFLSFSDYLHLFDIATQRPSTIRKSDRIWMKEILDKAKADANGNLGDYNLAFEIKQTSGGFDMGYFFVDNDEKEKPSKMPYMLFNVNVEGRGKTPFKDDRGFPRINSLKGLQALVEGGEEIGRLEMQVEMPKGNLHLAKIILNEYHRGSWGSEEVPLQAADQDKLNRLVLKGLNLAYKK